jgi:glucose-fructose oxidoreductase
MSSTRSSRRNFLRTTGASLAAVPFAATLAEAQGPNAQAPARTFGYAIVGIGSLAESDILPAFANSRRSRVTGLVSGDVEKAKSVAAQYGVPDKGLYSYDTFDRIADNPDIDAVYIVLPNNLHAEYAIRAFKAGKHVLVEKPMANTVKECDAMIAAGKAAGKQLLVGYRLRYEPFTQAMIAMRQKEELGKVKAIQADSGFNIGANAGWRLSKSVAGGGSMMDIGIYSVNAARYLSGEEPTEVFGMQHNTPNDPRFKEVEETIHFQMRFPSGVLANCISSYGMSLNHFRVFAERGSYEMEPAWNRTGLRMRVMRGNAVEQRYLPQRDHFAAMMDHLAQSVAANTPVLTDGADGRNDMRVIEAIYESVRTGRTVSLI